MPLRSRPLNMVYAEALDEFLNEDGLTTKDLFDIIDDNKHRPLLLGGIRSVFDSFEEQSCSDAAPLPPRHRTRKPHNPDDSIIPGTTIRIRTLTAPRASEYSDKTIAAGDHRMSFVGPIKNDPRPSRIQNKESNSVLLKAPFCGCPSTRHCIETLFDSRKERSCTFRT